MVDKWSPRFEFFWCSSNGLGEMSHENTICNGYFVRDRCLRNFKSESQLNCGFMYSEPRSIAHHKHGIP